METVIAVYVAIGCREFVGFVIGKLRGEKVGSYRQILLTALAAEVRDAIAAKLNEPDAREKFEAKAWQILERWFGLKQSPALKPIVGECVELALHELRAALHRIATEAAILAMPGDLAKLEAATAGIVDAFEPKPASERTVPPLGLEIEIVDELPPPKPDVD